MMNGEDDDLSFDGAGYSRPWHAACVPMKKKMDRQVGENIGFHVRRGKKRKKT